VTCYNIMQLYRIVRTRFNSKTQPLYPRKTGMDCWYYCKWNWFRVTLRLDISLGHSHVKFLHVELNANELNFSALQLFKLNLSLLLYVSHWQRIQRARNWTFGPGLNRQVQCSNTVSKISENYMQEQNDQRSDNM